ncbi:MAG: hypothetical protein JNN24_05480 [Hyphomicrobium zavarzinii]|jgi:hypothetical protein|uniref:hypothetical protein n=1 Tax=Hyphomicrobium zavarzinii TaxID=48292 RepID=UPI001A585541|nr:hypothetical protein [Hyphomicrobium zavarzinii]MBL8845202.1 hypothetical protein [Hyphomicrobium zavarzinii]
MMVLRFASLVAAAVTITLNATYGFKTSAFLQYAILFAALNAALDIAKCACLVGASRSWRAGQPLAALILFLMFWPLLANSLWCGLSEVAFNRASEQSQFNADDGNRTRAAVNHQRTSAELLKLEASPLFKSSTACALAKTPRERALCTTHASAKSQLAEADAILATKPAADPAPQITLLANWTGYDMATLLLATALWPIALAELCGSVGFYLSASPDRTERRWYRFRKQNGATPSSTPETPPKPQPTPHTQEGLRWPVIAS